MSSKHYTVSNLSELVDFIVTNPGCKDSKFNLEDRTVWEYDDPEAGKAWDKEDLELGYKWSGEPGYEEWKVQNDALDARKPHQHMVTHWTLSERSERYHLVYLTLSSELGEMIDGIWTKKAKRWNPKYVDRVGNLTLMGILKRIDKQLAQNTEDTFNQYQEEVKRKEAEAIQRRAIRNLAAEAKRLQDNHAKYFNEKMDLNINSMTLAQLVALAETMGVADEPQQ